jgi:hypothetical protein
MLFRLRPGRGGGGGGGPGGAEDGARRLRAEGASASLAEARPETLRAKAGAFQASERSTDQKAVQDVVEGFLLHLGDHQWDAVAAGLAPKALVVVTRQRPSTRPGRAEALEARDGQWSNTFQTGDEWLAALRRNQNPTTFREPISNIVVTIDTDRLAYLRADFQVIRDSQPQSKGVDQFTLVRESGSWKLAVIAYTSMPVR